jgi:alpha-1,2-mannosyltransferase
MFDKKRIILNGALGLIFAIAVAFYYITIITFADPQKPADFYKFYMSAKFYWEGKSIYAPVKIVLKNNKEKGSDGSITDKSNDIQSKRSPEHGNLNPPFQTLLLSPVGLVRYEHAFLIYSFLSLVCGLAAVLLIAHETAGDKYEPPLFLLFLIIIMYYYPTWANVLYGQLSLILLLLVALAWKAARQGRDTASGIYLGLAMSLKIFVGLFLVFFLVRRRWRLLGWFMGTFILLSLVPLWFFGIEVYKTYITILSNVTWYASSWNASFQGFFSRIFGGSENIPLVNLPVVTQILTKLGSLVFLCGLVWVAWPRAQERNRERFDLGFSLTIIGMLLICPLGWMYYFPTLLIPAVVAWRLAGRFEARFRYRALLIVAWLLSTTPHVLIQASQMNSPHQWFIWAGPYFYALLLFSFIVGSLAQHLKKVPDPGEPASA